MAKHLGYLGLAVGAAVAASTPASAQARAEEHSFNIPAQDLAAALKRVARTARQQITFDPAIVQGKRSRALKGRYSVSGALAELLAGTGLRADRGVSGIYIIRGTATASAAASSDVAGNDAPREIAPEIIVTGTRIRRDSFDAPVPMTAFSGEDIAESGRTELSEVLAELPAITSRLNERAVTGNVQNAGLSAIELRNLGDNRTLVLIDGRRTVSNSANGNRVSLSTIPSDFVERVEVITGGTSSVYGSDAVAGVVNIITEKKRTGLKLAARTDFTDAGGGREYQFDASLGAKFAGGRGYVLISGSYDRDEGIRANQREFALRQVDYGYDATLGINEFDTLYTSPTGIPTSGSQPATSFPPNEFRDLSSSIPGGVFYGSSNARDRFYVGTALVPIGPDVQTGALVPVGTSDAGNTGYFLPNRDGYNLRQIRSISGERERYLGAAKAEFAISDATTLFAQVQYSRVKTFDTREPSAVTSDSAFQLIDPETGLGTEMTMGRIPCRRAPNPCNPFVPDEIRRDVTTGTTNRGVFFFRRFTELGGQTTRNDRETMRSWAGARGKAWDGWDWEASFGYGRFRQDQLRGGEVNFLRLQQALDATTVGGQIVCRDPSNGCVPINLFGEGSITPEAADFIRTELHQRATVEQQNFSAFMTGDLLSLPAGPLSAAFGIDYRKDSQQIRGDVASRFGGTSGAPVPDFGGSISVFEGYGEFSAPLVRDKPGIALLSLDASARIGQYDIKNVGTIFSFRAGAQYAPVKDLRFRAQFARAQRAPDLTELFSPPRGDFDDVADICNGVTPTTTGQIAVNCRADPGIQASFATQAAEGEPQLFDQDGTSVFSPNAGNLGLREETADTLTLGAVFTPSFVPGLTLSADYYDIRIKDAIGSYGNREILEQCYNSELATAQNLFCGDVSRNPNNGQLSGIIQREFNLASFETAGLDVAANYRFDLDGIGIPGRWELRYDATHLFKHKTSFVGLTGLVTTDQRGELENRTFKYRARASLGWRHDGFSLRYTAIYFGKILDSRERYDAYRELLASNPDAEFPMFLKIPGVWQHNFFASYNADIGRADVRIFGGVTNIFDRISPFLPAGDVASGSSTNYDSTYDVAGRRFFLGMSVKL